MKSTAIHDGRHLHGSWFNPPQSRAGGAALWSEQAWKAVAGSLGLSGREVEIIRGVFDDQTEMVIASNLGISPHTVHTHLERLHHKLGVATRTQMAIRLFAEFLRLTSDRQSALPSICARRLAGECPRER